MTKEKFIKRRVPAYRQLHDFRERISDGDDVLSAIDSLKRQAENSKLELDRSSDKFVFTYENDDDYSSCYITLNVLETHESFAARQKQSRAWAEELWENLKQEKKDKAAENKKRELAELERLKKKYER